MNEAAAPDSGKPALANTTTQASSQVEERGLLEVHVEVSARDILAGRDFAVFVIVKNPFNRQIWIDSLFVTKPSELISASLAAETITRVNLLEKETREKDRIKTAHVQELSKALDRLSSRVEKSGLSDTQLKKALSDIERKFSAESSFGFMVGDRLLVDTLTLESTNANISVGSTAEIRNLEIRSPLARDIQGEMMNQVEMESSLPKGCALQSGSTVVYKSVLKVRNPLFFTPSSFRLQFSVNYSFSQIEKNEFKHTLGDIYSNSIAHTIVIRPSVFAIIIGSAFGGFSGSLALTLQNIPELGGEMFQLLPILSSVILSIVLSIIAAIFLARKSEAQSFVSVEDFWGGLLIGFFVGYTGTSFFDQIVRIPDTTQ